ncbi:MAG: hypothetical protein AAF328_11625 [Planctomycetota bacterium]
MSPPRNADPLPELRCTPLTALLSLWLALPKGKAHALVGHAEELHDTLEPDATYPLDFVAFKLTGYRRDYGDASLLVGVPLAHDLRWIIDAVTQRHPLPADADGARPVQAWAEALNVHPRTLRRWRDAGLRWRWIDSPGRAKPIVAHTQAAIDAFCVRHPRRVKRANRFAPLTAEEKQRAIEQAAQLATEAPQRSISNVAEQVAQELGRSHEAIRLLLLKHHERRQHSPHLPTTPFPKMLTGLTPRERRQTLRDRRNGVSLRAIAQRVGKSGPTLHRWLLAHRAAVLRRLRLNHVPSPLFDRDDAADVYLREALPEPRLDPTDRHDHLLSGLPPLVAELVRSTRHWDEGERRSALLRMNYLKHTAETARAGLTDVADLRAADLDRIERCVREAGQTRRQLVRGELAHLVSLLRRQAPAGFDPASEAFATLFGDGLVVLVEAIDSFNASGNRRFETYLRNRTQRALAPRVAALNEPEPDETGSAEARRRAVRRDAPGADALAWVPVIAELRRWVDRTPELPHYNTGGDQDASA